MLNTLFTRAWMSGFVYFVCLATVSLPASAAPSHQPSRETFLAPASVIDTAISPSGKYLAQVWDNEGLRIVTVQDLNHPDKPIIGHRADRITRAFAVSWANDERLLVRIRQPFDARNIEKKSEQLEDFDIRNYASFTRIYAMNADMSDVAVLMGTDPQAKNNRHLTRVSHYLPDDPKHVLMPNIRGNRWALSRVNVYTGKSEVVILGDRFTYDFISDRTGNPLYRMDYKPVARRLHILKLNGTPKDGTWEEIDFIDFDEASENEVLDESSLIGIFNDDLVYRKKNEDTGYTELIRYHNATKKIAPLVSLPDRNVLGVIVLDNTDEIVGYTILDGTKKYVLFDEAKQKQFDTLSNLLAGYNYVLTSDTRDLKQSVVFSYGTDDSGTYYLYDWNSEKLNLINYAHFGLRQENLSIPLEATFPARDGLPIHSYILVPRSYQEGERLPLVVLPHGGPASQDWATYDAFAQFISTRGYLVVQPNFRGSTGYGKAFEQAGYKQWGQAMQDDLTDVVQHLIAEGFVDPKKICIVGISYGGYAALMGSIKTPELYRCSISINGVTDLVSMVEHDAAKVKDERVVEKYFYSRMGHPVKDKLMLEQHSPALMADKIGAPTLVIGSTSDDIVPFSQQKKLVMALKKHGKQHALVELKDGEHDPFTYWEDEEKVYEEVEGFLKTHLQ